MFFFDLHCDTATEAFGKGLPLVRQNLMLDPARLPGDMCLAELYAIFIPDTLRGAEATDYFEKCAVYYEGQVAANADLMLPVGREYSVPDVWRRRKHAAMLSVEGGAMLAGEMSNIALLKKHHVRMLTLTWNGANEIGSGARAEGGLTAFGRALLPRLEREKIVIDTSHLNDETFWDVMETTRRPVVASHSNSRAVCNVPRNLTDDAFRAIAERRGLVGLNFFREFLSERPETASMSDILRHAEHFLTIGGEDVLVLGSDFDGAEMPQGLPNAEALSSLYDKLAAAFGKVQAEKICYKNALDFYRCVAAE